MQKSIVLVSGGMDSLVTLAIAREESEEIYLLHASYGQLTEQKEAACFSKLVTYYQPQGTFKTDISYLKAIGGSSLVDAALQVPLRHDEEGVPNTYVPFRNAHLIAIAVSWAEVIGADRIYIGAVEEDSSGYPDCRQVFYESYEKTIGLGTKNEIPIKICTPVIHLSKREIVEKGKQLKVPFAYSYSCYKNSDRACGKCASCRLRIKAFQEAGLVDPIDYEIDIAW